MQRFGNRGAVWQRCRAVIGVAINIACTVLLAVVPSHPTLLLGAADICLKLRRPRRAYEAVARLSTIDVEQIAQPDRTAKQMTKIAAAICARGQRVEAEDVLRKAIALAPQFAAPLSLPNTRFAHTDDASRQGSDAQQCLRIARLGACRERPSRAKREFALRYSRKHILQEFVEGALR
jgi:hypothetical protein